MKYCANCGKASEESARFCPQCGTALGQEENSEKNQGYSNQIPVHEYHEYHIPVAPEPSEPISTGLKVLLYVLTFFISPVGIIAGIIYLSDPLEEKKRFGKGLLIFGIVWTLLGVLFPILGFIAFRNFVYYGF